MVTVKNWKKSIAYEANSVEVMRSVEQLQEIVRNKKEYPSPVRGKGSHHSTTKCIVAENGTVVDFSQFNKIISIDKQALTITMQAGVQLADAAKALENEGLQFHVNIELGNLTMGSGATGSTKDASCFANGEWEMGQVCSYCVGMKTVQPDGDLLEVTEEHNPELIAAMRTGFGMLGIVYEVTFRVKPISALAVEHRVYSVDDFASQLDDILDQSKSVMLYLFPFLDKVVVEFRHSTDEPIDKTPLVWSVRNWTWKTLWPGVAKTLSYLPVRSVRYWITNRLNSFTTWFMAFTLRDSNTSPVAQIIRYSESGGYASYTFSIWAFSREAYPETIKKYFAFSKAHYRKTGYRCDLLNVGYHIAQDKKALFSYTRDWPALTLDPVSTGGKGWPEFLDAYNEFCSDNDGRPLFNQSAGVTQAQANRAFGDQIEAFRRLRSKCDPDGRFYNAHFESLFGV